jgi:acyl phosphate:glycerol-3-phosphate acyltransferase
LWIPLLAFCVTWAIVAAATRYSSLAALLACIAAPMAISLKGDVPELRLFMILSILLWLTHRANISRLMNGTESKIGSH